MAGAFEVREPLKEANARCFGCFEPREDGGSVCPHCGWSEQGEQRNVLHLRPGTLLHECYTVGRTLGQGGFGITYIAWDNQLNRKVAIKEYFPQMLSSRRSGTQMVVPTTPAAQPDFEYGLRSFLNEGRTLAGFADHPSIASVFSLFVENQTGYLVMGYLEGETLAQHLWRYGGRIPYHAALGILMRVLDGLREVHAHGLLHRDISPDNIYLTRQGPVKILDFGAARLAVSERSQSVSAVLKEGFAPEEQYRLSGNQGPWTDVYAAAATLYRAITGITPPPALDRMHLDTLKSPRELGAAMPPEAEHALMQALAISAGNRFQSVEAFQNALEATGAAQPEQPLPPPSQPPPAASGPAYRLFSAGSVRLAAFFGSPVAGALLMAMNYRRLGKKDAAAASIAIGVAGTALAIALAYPLSTGPSFGIAIGLVYGTFQAAKSLQGKALDEHVRQGGRLASRWSAFGLGIAVLALLFAAIVAGVVGYEAFGNPKIAIGTRDSVHYSGSATKEQAAALGQALKTAGYFRDRGADALLWKDRGGAAVSFVVKNDSWNQPGVVEGFDELGRQVAPLVGGYPIHVRLLNAREETQKQRAVGKVLIGRNDEVYYFGAAAETDFYGAKTEAEARNLGNALKTRGFFTGRGATVLLSKDNGTEVLSFVVRDAAWEDPRVVAFYEGLAREVSDTFRNGIAVWLGGGEIRLRLVNSSLEVKREWVVRFRRK